MTELPELVFADAGQRAGFRRVMAASLALRSQCRQRPQWFQRLLDSGELERGLGAGELAASLRARLGGCPDRERLGQVLRDFRRWHWARIAWRDVCRLADTLETTRDMSLLAEACITRALDWLHEELAARHGAPLDSRGEPQQLLVLAMGKLGAGELNLSSDVDLVFAYPEAGVTGGDGIGDEEFFTRLGQRLIKALDEVTAEGFVFRVDMRLRPYGQSGALVPSLAALERYYREQGRDWERYALIKARPLTGRERHRRQLQDALRPFVFRRYIDFGAIDSLREMKGMIEAEMRRKEVAADVKLGPGGIREIEFIAQCFQLIRGGRSAAFQCRELLSALRAAAAAGCLTETAAGELRAAYLFLRDVEHAIQVYEDRQTHLLPAAGEARAALLAALGRADWQAFEAALKSHRDAVRRHFAALVAEAEAPPEDERGPEPWPDGLDAGRLRDFGLSEPEACLSLLREFRDHARVRALECASRQRLDQFMPRLLRACRESGRSELALGRLLPLVQEVIRRSAYLVLLLENPAALRELVRLCVASPWIAGQLRRNPVLLDMLLDADSLYTAPDKLALERALRERMAHLPADDSEGQMDALRHFKAAQVLHVAASEVTGRLPLMQVSDKLTFLAEAILQRVLELAWADLTARHGNPRRASGGKGFAIVGYGKLGGIELGPRSDLDLVFLYDAPGQERTDGERALDNAVFYTRLGQRIIHILGARTGMGQLYEVDMQLRPSGSSGLLVSSFGAYREYQLGAAWTWEHQALVRARHIAGDEALGRQFAELRREVLARPRPRARLAREVLAMRDKMRGHLAGGRAGAGEFHLKRDSGGIVDIEFLVQFAVLAGSSEHEELSRWPDVVRILETMRRVGALEERSAAALTGAYLEFRSAAHRLALMELPAVAPAEKFREHRAAVLDAWRALLEREAG